MRARNWDNQEKVPVTLSHRKQYRRVRGVKSNSSAASGEKGSERSCLLTHPGGLAEEHRVSCRENRARVSFLLGSSGVCVCLHAFGYVCVGGREVIRSDLLGFHFFFFSYFD